MISFHRYSYKDSSLSYCLANESPKNNLQWTISAYLSPCWKTCNDQVPRYDGSPIDELGLVPNKSENCNNNPIYFNLTWFKYWFLCAYGVPTSEGNLRRNNHRGALNPLMPSGSFIICCPRDCVSRTANEKLVTIVANRH